MTQVSTFNSLTESVVDSVLNCQQLLNNMCSVSQQKIPLRFSEIFSQTFGNF